MGVYYYLLPKTEVHADPIIAGDWLERERRNMFQVPTALDPKVEAQKRGLADVVRTMKPDFREFELQHEAIAQYEKIAIDEARRKYRHIEISGPDLQLTICDRHVEISVGSKVDMEELDALLSALSSEGNLVFFDPQSELVIDLGKDSLI